MTGETNLKMATTLKKKHHGSTTTTTGPTTQITVVDPSAVKHATQLSAPTDVTHAPGAGSTGVRSERIRGPVRIGQSPGDVAQCTTFRSI